jgi:membrane protein DedA with SNARE-associated domain
VKLLPLIAAALALSVIGWRWPRLTRSNQTIGLGAVLALAVYGSGVIHPPSLDTLIRDAGSTLGSYTYLLVGVLAFLETGAGIGLIAPGELAVIVGGVTAGQGAIDLWLLIALVWACAIAGDTTSFFLGRRLGREFMLRHGPRVKLTAGRIEQVERFFARHGGKTLLLGRFIGLVRALAPFLAGASKLPFRRFFPYALVASGVWAATFSVLGYVFWQSFDEIANLARQGTFALTAVVALLTAATMLYRHLRVPQNRRRVRSWVLRRPPSGQPRRCRREAQEFQ